MRIKLNQLLNESTYKSFTVSGLENIIGNFITKKAYDQLIGNSTKEKAENLHHTFQRQKMEEIEDKNLNRIEIFKKGRGNNSLLKNKKIL